MKPKSHFQLTIQIHQFLLAASVLIAVPLRAQVVNDGATATLSNVTNSFTGDVTVGTNGSFTLLVLSDNALLTNSANGVIGRNITARSNQVSLISASARWRMGGTLFIGSNGALNQLVVSNGALVEDNNGILGSRIESSNNAALVTGPGSRWSNRLDLTVGVSGPGNQLVLSNGALMTDRIGNLGLQPGSSNNLVVVTGSGSYWSNQLDLNVSVDGQGNRLLIEAGGLVNCDNGRVGAGAFGSSNEALVTGPGSLWISRSDLAVGLNAANNRLVVSNGAAVVASGNGRIGAVTSATGNQLLVTGAGSLWSNQLELQVGEAGAGNRLEVNSGGWVVNSNAYIGNGGSSNLALVTGNGSVWSNRNDLIVGNLSAGNQMVVSNGAMVTAGNLFVGFNIGAASNRVTVDGGTLCVTNVAGNGKLDVRHGTNVLVAGLIEVDQLLLTNAAGRFEFNGGTLSTRSSAVNNSPLFRVGNGTSAATFTLAGNGAHTFANGMIISSNATLNGDGKIGGAAFLTVANGGILAPGTSIGKIVLSNTPSLQGNLRMEISKNGAALTNDQIEVQGVLALLPLTYGGSLTVTNIGTNSVTLGDRFQLFNAATYNGSFATKSLPPLPLPLDWADNLLVDGSIQVLDATPSVTTLPATALAGTSATLNGVGNPSTRNTSAWFEWGTTTHYGSFTPLQLLGTGSNNVSFSQIISGLPAGVTHHFRAVASNDFAVVVGADRSFSVDFADAGAGLPGADNSAGIGDPTSKGSGAFVAWGDFDNDGRLDISVGGGGGFAGIWRNTGTTFTNIYTDSAASFQGSVAVADYDNDGRLDVLLTGEEALNQTTKLIRNTSSGFTNLNPVPAALPGSAHSSVAWGDCDNDGRLDLLLPSTLFSFLPVVWLNTGSSFTAFNTDLPTGFQGSVGWGDWDNDGRLDILLTGGFAFAGFGSQVWRRTEGGFTNIDAGLPTFIQGSVSWGDYDNDGRLDILLTGTDGSTNRSLIFRNTGTGFTNINAGLPGVGLGSAAWGDYDNDGRLDILLTGTTNGSASGAISQIWRNIGSGFTNINAGLPAVFQSSVAWGDYDNDGRLDILIAGSNSVLGKICQVWRNQILVTNTPPSAPTGLTMTNSGTTVTLRWNASSDGQTPASALTYNVRIGTTPGGSDVMGPMASSSGLRRLPQMGNAQERLFTLFNGKLDTPYYWSVQAVDNAFAGSAFSAESNFRVLQLPRPAPVLAPASTTNLLNGDLNGDGYFDETELQTLLGDYFSSSPFLQMTNVGGLGDTNVTFALTNSLAGAFSVEYTTNLIDWLFLGPATPRYEFTDTNAPSFPQRYYRLRWP